MKTLKILFTGVGRRIELIQAFREAALHVNVNLIIYGADMAGTAPALSYCDYTCKVCGMKEANYISELVEICEENKIDVLIPTIDTDLMVLSKNIRKFKNTKVLISRSDMIAICRDKNRTASFFESCGLKAPNTVSNYRKYKGEFPCFIKPKDGSSSINAFRAEDAEELELYAKQIEEYVIQPFIEGTEYTVDVFSDFSGEPIYIIPRARLQVRAGEVLKTKISMDERIIKECKSIICKFKPVGPITIQLIRQNATGDDYYIEINPRYGGGVPLSMKAGARSAECLLRLLLEQKLEGTPFINDGAIYSRFDQSVCIHEGEVKPTVRGIIFDLDDTLYDEVEYVKSGFNAIARYLCRNDAAEKLWYYFEKKVPAIDAYLEEVGQNADRDECLRVYREHKPNLVLNSETEELLRNLKKEGIKIGIITDGRSSSQRNKIEALGLDKLVDDIIITDELGGEQFRKPCDIPFRIMQRRWKLPYEQLMYIGDNMQKDFQAPKQLGMQWMLVKNERGLYKEEKRNKEECTAKVISNINELMDSEYFAVKI